MRAIKEEKGDLEEKEKWQEKRKATKKKKGRPFFSPPHVKERIGIAM